MNGGDIMVDMILCGLSMEMRAAEEMGHIGKCIGCLYCEGKNNNEIKCEKRGVINEQENCEDWFVDYR